MLMLEPPQDEEDDDEEDEDEFPQNENNGEVVLLYLVIGYYCFSPITINLFQGNCRARSACTFLQSDLALHFLLSSISVNKIPSNAI